MDNAFLNYLEHEGLYKKIVITEENIEQLLSFIGEDFKLNLYCPDCRTERVFIVKSFRVHSDEGYELGNNLVNRFFNMLNRPHFVNIKDKKDDFRNRLLTYWKDQKYPFTLMITLCCAMNNNHRVDYVLHATKDYLMKVGQYPSIATLSFSEIDCYENVMDPEIRKEFGTAIGLFAHGVGIGSYVYLRRIFEKIINATADEAIDAGYIDRDGIQNQKMADKIKTLKDYLPEIMGEKPELYSILSKGIHELSEEECVEFFPILKDSILLILNQREQKRQETEMKKRLNSSISKIASKLK